MPGSDYFLISQLPPSRGHYLIAAGILTVLICVLLVTAPFARVPLANTEVLLPAYAAAYFINGLMTAALLFALYSIQRSQAILALSIGYLFSSLMMPSWVLTFPGLFAEIGLSDAGLQTTASIAAVRRLAFPVFVLAYVLLRDAHGTSLMSQKSVRWRILASIMGTLIVAGGLSWLVLANQDTLPPFMRDATDVSELWQYVPITALLLYAATLIALWTDRRSVLDLWLMIVLCTLIFEVALLAYMGGGQRLSVGWWTGRLFGLVSFSVILLVMLSQTTTLYSKLARSIFAERRSRDAQLSAAEAMSASVAHEVNQPLASMITNANAGLRWLGNQEPSLEETRAALTRIVRDGHRAGRVIEGIKAIYRKGAQDRVPLDLNLLIKEVLRRSQNEAQLAHISLETNFDCPSAMVTGNPVQLQQVVSNLVANAIEAMSAEKERARVLRLQTSLQGDDNVLVLVEDTGAGLDPQVKERIFEPFFTTKPDGMGMGLMVCRSIIEAHGGRLQTMEKGSQGAVFQFTLPRHDEPRSTERHTQ